MGTVFISSYSWSLKNANTFCVFLQYVIYIDVRRSRWSNKLGKLFIYTHKYIVNTLKEFPVKGTKKRTCLWYVFNWSCSRRVIQGAFGQKLKNKIAQLFLIHVHNLYYYFSTRESQLWCGGRAGGREQLNVVETTKIGNVLGVVE